MFGPGIIARTIEASGILGHLAAGGNLSRWGFANAVTRYAQDVESYDRATELEKLGGKLSTNAEGFAALLATA